MTTHPDNNKQGEAKASQPDEKDWERFRAFLHLRLEDAENQPEIHQSFMDIFHAVMAAKNQR